MSDLRKMTLDQLGMSLSTLPIDEVLAELRRRDADVARLVEACRFYIAGKDSGVVQTGDKSRPNEYGGTLMIRDALKPFEENADAR